MWITIGLQCAIVSVIIVWGVALALFCSAVFVLTDVFGLSLPFG